VWRASISAKGWFQQPNPTPDQKLTLLPPPQIRPRHEYDGLDLTLSGGRFGGDRQSGFPHSDPKRAQARPIQDGFAKRGKRLAGATTTRMLQV
jgi:hypothetical protein